MLTFARSHDAKMYKDWKPEYFGGEPRVLRKLLVECAWCMLRYNPWAREQYARRTGGGTTRKTPAIVALARKLLVRCWAMLRDGKPWPAAPAWPAAAVEPTTEGPLGTPAGVSSKRGLFA